MAETKYESASTAKSTVSTKETEEEKKAREEKEAKEARLKETKGKTLTWSALTIEEYNEELNEKAGPNPTPNREGNIKTKIENGVIKSEYIEALMNLHWVDTLRAIREEGKVTDEQKEELEKMQQELELIGANV